jgi:hypothetical protein
MFSMPKDSMGGAFPKWPSFFSRGDAGHLEGRRAGEEGRKGRTRRKPVNRKHAQRPVGPIASNKYKLVDVFD